MKVAIITNFPPKTGIGNYSYQLFRELNKKVDADLIFCGEEKLTGEKIKNVTAWKLPVFSKTLNAYFYYPNKIPEGYDIYHLTNQFLTRVLKFRKPAVITIQDLDALRSKKYLPFLTRYLQKRSFKYLGNAAKIITTSEDSKKDIIKFLHVKGKEIIITPLGVNHKLFKRIGKKFARKKLGLPKDEKIIIHVGSEEPRKNVESLMKAFYKLTKIRNDLLLLRIGQTSEKITKLVKKLGIEESVRRIGTKSYESLPAYYSAADVFIILDTDAGFGLPPLEAMCCGLPVISSNHGALPEVVGNAAKLVNPLDIDQISKAILHVLSDNQLRASMIKKGLERSKMFSWKKCAEETLKVYRNVLANYKYEK